MLQHPTPDAQRPSVPTLIIVVITVAALLALALLPAHTANPWLPTALALLALTALDQPLQREQADTVQRLIEGVLTQFGETLDRRVAAIESQVATALQALQRQLPDAMQTSIQAALSGAVELVDMVREQAGTLAHTVAQVGQNADRQVQAYNQWANRIADWQLRLDQTLTAAQAAQSEMLTGWQQRAEQSLGRIDQSLNQAGETSRKGHEAQAQAINYFAQRVVTLEAPLKTLQDQLNALQPPIGLLHGALAQMNAPLTANAGAMDGLNSSTNNLTRALMLVATSEQQRSEQAEKLTTAYTQSMSVALQRLNETTQVLNMTLQTLQRISDSARPR